MADFSAEELGKLTEKLRNERGLDFRDYKPASLGRRIQRRLDATKCPDMAGYIKLLDRRPDEYSKLIDSILINVTQFFRDPEAWDVIRRDVIPRIMAEKRPGDQIRFWSAGCASGEEAYSLAITVAEILGSRMGEYDVRIYATDIDEDALAIARRAEYSDEAVASLPTDILEKHFVRNGQWTVKRDLRKLLIFGRHNLGTDAPISHVDLIACRNVLIYMSVDLQNRILSKFHYGLEMNGFLFLGKAESLLAASRVFSPASERWRIFRKESAMRGTGRVSPDQQRVGVAVETGSAEYQQFSVFNESVIRHTPTGLLAVDNDNTIKLLNPAAESIWGIRGADVLDRPIMQVAESPALQEMLPKVTQARAARAEMRVDQLNLSVERGKPFYVSVSMSPMFDVRGNAIGVIMVAENVTHQVKLRDELEAAYEQLQAANEELETTNEELQSTNEELETTNEELQSTNEELETTNEELQSTNEELSTTNDELAVRTSDMAALTAYYGSVVGHLDIPMVVTNTDCVVTTWNPRAEQFYGIKESDAAGRAFTELNLPVRVPRLRERLRSALASERVCESRPVEYRTRTGDTRKFILRIDPLVDTQGNCKGLLLTARDAEARALEPAAPA